MSFFLGWWYLPQRRIDLKILWPQCVAQASDLDHAKAAFAFHAFHDRAWMVLGEERMKELIDGLEGQK